MGLPASSVAWYWNAMFSVYCSVFHCIAPSSGWDCLLADSQPSGRNIRQQQLSSHHTLAPYFSTPQWGPSYHVVCTVSDLVADCLRGRLSSYPFDFHHCSCCQQSSSSSSSSLPSSSSSSSLPSSSSIPPFDFHDHSFSLNLMLLTELSSIFKIKSGSTLVVELSGKIIVN